MECKFFRKVSATDMAGFLWGDITTPTWAASEFKLYGGEFALGRDRAIWLLGTIKEINEFCARHSGTKLRVAPGGMQRTQQFSVLVKNGGNLQVVVQLRAHMPRDTARRSVGLKSVKNPCPSFRHIRPMLDIIIPMIH